MVELHVRERLRGLEHVVHEAEAGAVDDVVALARIVLEDALRVSGFGHVLGKRRLDTRAQRLLEGFATVVVGVGPAVVVDRSRVDECGAYLLSASGDGRRGGRRSGWLGRRGGGGGGPRRRGWRGRRRGGRRQPRAPQAAPGPPPGPAAPAS